MSKIFKVGLIGCGHISETYFRAQEYFNNIRIVKCADKNMDAAKKCAIHYNIEAVTVDELLKDKEIEIILNLTIPGAHYQVSKLALENGKHSYAEKPLAVNFEDGKKLVELANKKNLYIGNAPDTFLGGGIQKTRELIDNGVIGDIKLGDSYRPEKSNGKKSYSFSVTINPSEGTLSDKQIKRISDKIVKSVSREFNAVLRDQ